MSDKLLELLRDVVETQVTSSVEAKGALDNCTAAIGRHSGRVEKVEGSVERLTVETSRLADAFERLAKAEEDLAKTAKAKARAETKAGEALSARWWGLLHKSLPYLLPILFGAGGIAGGAWGMNEYKPADTPPAIVEPIEVPNVQP